MRRKKVATKVRPNESGKELSLRKANAGQVGGVGGFGGGEGGLAPCSTVGLHPNSS